MDKATYERIKPRLEYVTLEGESGLYFHNDGLNDDLGIYDDMYIDQLFFPGRKNKWNVAQWIESLYPFIGERLK